MLSSMVEYKIKSYIILSKTMGVIYNTNVYQVSYKQQYEQQREEVFSKDQINVIRVYLMGN